MRLLFCGVRGSTSAPGADFVRVGGHTSCVALAHDGQPWTLALDAGTGIRRITDQLDGRPFVGSVVLTHLHWDHVQGLPFFAAADRDDAHVRVFMPDQIDADGRARDPFDVLALAMSPPHFPIGPDGLRGAWTFESVKPGSHRIEGFDVVAFDVPHKGGRTYGYRVSDGVVVDRVHPRPLPGARLHARDRTRVRGCRPAAPRRAVPRARARGRRPVRPRDRRRRDRSRPPVPHAPARPLPPLAGPPGRRGGRDRDRGDRDRRRSRRRGVRRPRGGRDRPPGLTEPPGRSNRRERRRRNLGADVDPGGHCRRQLPRARGRRPPPRGPGRRRGRGRVRRPRRPARHGRAPSSPTSCSPTSACRPPAPTKACAPRTPCASTTPTSAW